METTNILFEIAKAASLKEDRNNFKEKYQLSENNNKEAVKEAIKNDDIVKSLKETIFPGEIKINNDFYEKIEIFYTLCGFFDEIKILCSKISKLIFDEIGHEKTNQLLDLLLSSKERFSWLYLGVLYRLLGLYNLDPLFATNWFWQIAERIKDDLGGGEFYNGIENYALNFPNSAFEVIKNILGQELDNTFISIASILLGAIRTDKEFVKNEDYVNLDYNLKHSKVDNERKLFYYSFSITYRRKGIDIKELENVLTDLSKENKDVSSIQFNLLERCALYLNEDKEFILFALEWIKNHAENVSDISQYNISTLMYWISKKIATLKDENIIKNLSDVLSLILPIKTEYKGTWRNIEYYLEDLLGYDKESFNSALQILIDKSSDEFLDILQNDNQFFLINTLEQKNYNEFIFPLLISKNPKLRNFGFELLQDIGVTVPKYILNNGLGKDELRILLYSISLRYIVADKIGDLMLTISPLYLNADNEIKNEFIGEMIFQALNLPGACLDKWEIVKEKNDIMTKVTSVAKKYYLNLRKTNEIPANNFIFPEIAKGEEQWRRQFSSDFSKNVKEKSIFLKLIKTTNVLYGNKWSIPDENSMRDPMGFTETKTDIEWPRMELIDPEGMEIRRVNIRSELKSISK